jgi:hypothetical protein
MTEKKRRPAGAAVKSGCADAQPTDNLQVGVANVKSFFIDTAEYERSVLGSYLMGAAPGPGMNAAVFADTKNRLAFIAIKNLLAAGVKPDIITLTDALRKPGHLEEAGGAAYIAALTNTVPTTANLAFYEARVLEGYRARRQWEAATRLKETLEAGADAAEAVKTMKAAIEGGGGGRDFCFADLTTAEMVLPDRDFLVAGHVQRGEIGFIGAPGNTGKSFTLVDLSCSIAWGIPWGSGPEAEEPDTEASGIWANFKGDAPGYHCEKAPVYYFSGEGSIAPRVLAWRKYHAQEIAGITPAPFHAQDFGLAQGEPWYIGFSRLGELRDTLPEDAVVVIDTFSTAFEGDSENDNAQAAEALRYCRSLTAGTRRVVIIAHHTKKNDPGTFRGASAIYDNSDFVFSLALQGGPLSQGGVSILSCQKQRNAAFPPAQAFRFDYVDLPTASGGTEAMPIMTPCEIPVPEAKPVGGVEPKVSEADRMRAVMAPALDAIPAEGIIRERLLQNVMAAMVNANEKYHSESTAGNRIKTMLGLGWLASEEVNGNTLFYRKLE